MRFVNRFYDLLVIMDINLVPVGVVVIVFALLLILTPRPAVSRVIVSIRLRLVLRRLGHE